METASYTTDSSYDFSILPNSTSNTSDYDELYDFLHVINSTKHTDWITCENWTQIQQPLFQTANFFVISAFVVPGSFKQSVLIVRALLCIGYFFLAIWASVEVCALDLFLWTCLLVLINFIHTVILTLRFLPATLSVELGELYEKIFKPLKVSRKHFKELIREAEIVQIEKGDIYAVEDVSPADERLSILLKGRMRVTCDDIHLHFINMHQFVDSPEWEANHDQSDDIYQVTITAEDNCTYLCWPRMQLERVLRHRPLLKVVFDALIGKDITQKLYALNEHLAGVNSERQRGKRDEMWARAQSHSLSMDAVDTGTTGLVRSQYFRNTPSIAETLGSVGKVQAQCWIPIVATQFPATSPFKIPKELQTNQNGNQSISSKGSVHRK